MPNGTTPHQGEQGKPAVEPTIEDYFSEDRSFPPSEQFASQAVMTDPAVYGRAESDWRGFWAEQAGALDWFRPWDSVLEWELPFARWFDGGTLNVSYNCLDRHVAAGRGDKVAFHWEGEPGDTRTVTYYELLREVSRFANVLRGLGVQRGDAGEPDEERGQELRAHVAEKIGPIARPKTVIFTDELPKTRSGKIMRRLLRDVAEGRVLGDTTTLADPAVVEEIRRLAASAPTDE
jgi:hypothetical protein